MQLLLLAQVFALVSQEQSRACFVSSCLHSSQEIEADSGKSVLKKEGRFQLGMFERNYLSRGDFWFISEDHCLNGKFCCYNMKRVSGFGPANVRIAWVSERTSEFCWRIRLPGISWTLWCHEISSSWNLWSLFQMKQTQRPSVRPSVSWSHQDGHTIVPHTGPGKPDRFHTPEPS